jgi:sugar lactone lactonase YvrE
MKKILVPFLIFLGFILSLASCSNNNNTPTRPFLGASGNSTPTSGGFTVSASPTPVFVANYGTAAAPNGIINFPCCNTDRIFIATGEYKTGGIVNGLESFTVGTSTIVNYNTNWLVMGIPTPGIPSPGWAGTTVVLNVPQAYVYTPAPAGSDPYYSDPLTGNNGWFGILDTTPGGPATLYGGNWFSDAGGTYRVYQKITTGFDAVAFNSPRALVVDSTNGDFYVADTGNGYIDQFAPPESWTPAFPPQAWLHRWNGASSNFPIKQPVALAADTATPNNIYVADAGYNPSVVSEFSSGGTTLLGSWSLLTGCVANGLAVDNAGDFYVSDTAFQQVEEYHILTPTTLSLLRVISDPHSAHEFLPFNPSAIALIGLPGVLTNIVVGDTNNDLIQIFGP